MGCGGVRERPPPPPPDRPEPAGWIYFQTAEDIYAPPARVNVATGVVQRIDLPPPFAPEPDYVLLEGFASPRDGDLTGDAKLGGTLRDTFVLDAATGKVTIYRDSSSPFSIAVDSRHRWAPDGSAVLFERHMTQQPCCIVWVLLHPATGVLDTLGALSTLNPYKVTWLGADTLLYISTAAPSYWSYAVATGDTATWNEVPYDNALHLNVSADRQWITYWQLRDSTVAGAGSIQFIDVRLVNRRRRTDTVITTQGDTSHITALLSESFSPDSRFLAFCAAFTTIRIVDLATGRTVKDLPVPFCYALTWSWGPEGPPGGGRP